MKIIRAQDAVQLTKPEGSTIRYYLFNDYEIHYTEQPPHTTQVWHHHEKIWETIYIIEGELIIRWREGHDEKSQVLKAGDVIETERTPHTFSNETGKVVKILAVKHIPSTEDFSETFKNDKVLD